MLSGSQDKTDDVLTFALVVTIWKGGRRGGSKLQKLNWPRFCLRSSAEARRSRSDLKKKKKKSAIILTSQLDNICGGYQTHKTSTHDLLKDGFSSHMSIRGPSKTASTAHLSWHGRQMEKRSEHTWTQHAGKPVAGVQADKQGLVAGRSGQGKMVKSVKVVKAQYK